jgi:hypothetical protein
MITVPTNRFISAWFHSFSSRKKASILPTLLIIFSSVLGATGGFMKTPVGSLGEAQIKKMRASSTAQGDTSQSLHTHSRHAKMPLARKTPQTVTKKTKTRPTRRAQRSALDDRPDSPHFMFVCVCVPPPHPLNSKREGRGPLSLPQAWRGSALHSHSTK